jgi:hypothetical protein
MKSKHSGRGNASAPERTRRRGHPHRAHVGVDAVDTRAVYPGDVYAYEQVFIKVKGNSLRIRSENASLPLIGTADEHDGDSRSAIETRAAARIISN